MTDSMPPTLESWEQETLYFSGDPYFEALLNCIRSATASVDLECYIFERDALGTEVLSELAAAAKRGIIVRLLIDGIGSYKWTEEQFLALKKNQKIEARFFNEPIWRHVFGQTPPHVSLGEQITRGFKKMNKRNHRKLCVIDKQVAFAGSFNVAAYHCERFVGAKAWRDTGLEVRGAGVKFLAELFEYTWHRSENRVAGVVHTLSSENLPPLIRTNFTRALRARYYRDLLHRIAHAEHAVDITTPYFVPNRRFVQALKACPARGVRVRILTPRISDVPLLRWTAMEFYSQLLKAKVEVYEYLPSILHAKTLTVDDWAIVGSTNINNRSLLHDLEIDFVVSKETNKKKLAAQFELDISKSEVVQEKTLKNRPWLEKWAGRQSLLFRHWL